MEEAKERLRHAINLDKDISKIGARPPRFEAFVGLDCWLGVVFQQHPFACIKIGG
jgi:hypothetical protein